MIAIERPRKNAYDFTGLVIKDATPEVCAAVLTTLSVPTARMVGKDLHVSTLFEDDIVAAIKSLGHRVKLVARPNPLTAKDKDRVMTDLGMTKVRVNGKVFFE